VCACPTDAPPEVVSGRGRSCAADWWALGILLHEMLTGRPPFEGSSAEEVRTRMHVHPAACASRHMHLRRSMRTPERPSAWLRKHGRARDVAMVLCSSRARLSGGRCSVLSPSFPTAAPPPLISCRPLCCAPPRPSRRIAPLSSWGCSRRASRSASALAPPASSASRSTPGLGAWIGRPRCVVRRLFRGCRLLPLTEPSTAASTFRERTCARPPTPHKLTPRRASPSACVHTRPDTEAAHRT
jgi:serine/threonine protein kinase